MANVSVDKKKCTGCGTCSSVCPIGVFDIKSGKSQINSAKKAECLQCRVCETSCPNGAIKVE